MIGVQQREALTELINIGFGRAGAALSELTGYRVLLDPPSVEIRGIDELVNPLPALTDGDLATVHQVFSGSVAGDALLVLSERDAAVLARQLAAGDGEPTRLSGSDKDVLTEIGNILLNACLGTFGNVLQVRMTFHVPRLRLESLGALVQSLRAEAEEVRYGLVITTRFRVRETEITGYIVVVMGVSSLDQLFRAVEVFVGS